MSKDPWVGSAMQPMSYNPYLYGYNNPIQYTDPSGENPLLGLMLIVAGVGALVVEVGQIQEYAERNNMTFLEAANDADLYLDQGLMVDTAVRYSMLVPMFIGGIQFLIVGVGDLAGQGGIWFNNTDLWKTGIRCYNAAATWETFWWTGTIPSSSSASVGYYHKVEFDGVSVYQNPSIDWDHIDPKTGMTNLELIQEGIAPIGPDGLKIVLHHIGQNPEGPLAEVTMSIHRNYYAALHWNTGQYPGMINRGQFDTFREIYWIWRSEQLINLGE